ncbi:Rhs family protein [Vibrio navarrensis]|nr:Rhs family protein [Vibrio navarrensis]
MINPYAHHTVFKKGRGKQMRVYLDESKDILEKYDIDWYRGPENLGWARNKNHSTEAAKAVRDELVKADVEVGKKEAVLDVLETMKTLCR